MYVAAGLGGDIEGAAEQYVQSFAAKAEIVVQIQRQIQADRRGGGFLFLLFADYHHVVAQCGHAGVLEAETAFVGFQGTGQCNAGCIGIQHSGVAAQGKAAVGLVEHLVFIEYCAHVYIGRGADQTDVAGKGGAAAAVEGEVIDNPSAALQTRAQYAVIQNHALGMIAVIQVITGEGAV